MTFKQIEAARETRLWITQMIIPAATAVAVVMSIPEVRRSIAEKFNGVKNVVANKFKKGA